jgi:hypothetical protein
MSYEAVIASFGGDDTTLTKSFIISLENGAANWYARLPPRSIASWVQLKEKFLVNFQSFHAELSTEEDFSRANNMKERHCQIFPHVPSSQSVSPEGLRRVSHNTSHKSTVRWSAP